MSTSDEEKCPVRCEAGCSSGEPSCAREIPSYDVFLGGSCGNTVWRRQLVIPYLKKRAISYYDPQRSVWSENMIYEESIAKENSSLFLFVLDPATVNATSFLEIAYFAARKAPKLVVVFLGRTEWREKAHPEDMPDRLRTCHLLDRILAAHQVPLLHSIEEALSYIEEEIIGTKSWREAMSVPSQRIPYLGLRTAAWGKVREAASRLAVTGVADTVLLVGTHFLVPAIPVYFLLIPLLVLNILLIGLHSMWKKARMRRPRGIVDIRMGARIPVPRMHTVISPQATQVERKITKKALKQSEQLLKSFGVDRDVERMEMNPWRRVSPCPSPSEAVKSPQQDVTSSHVYLGCSSLDELEWVNKQAAPFLQKHEIVYSTVLACDSVPPEGRMALLKKGSRSFRQVLYHIPSTTTFLSGMVEIAYLLGHSDWQVTLCVSKEAETLQSKNSDKEDEAERASRRRRNDCYAIAFCYLKDMAKRHQCRVFSEMDEALHQCLRLAHNGGC
ncbi:unnamed protein product, partial [Mesorhabditis spiculigera]